MASGFKAPPVMREGLIYEDWKKELSIWRKFTDLSKQRQGGALFLTLTGKARETVLAEVPLSKFDEDSGIDEITKALDTLYLQDATENAFLTFDSFIKFRTPHGMSLKEYLAEFNPRYNKIKDNIWHCLMAFLHMLSWHVPTYPRIRKNYVAPQCLLWRTKKWKLRLKRCVLLALIWVRNLNQNLCAWSQISDVCLSMLVANLVSWWKLPRNTRFICEMQQTKSFKLYLFRWKRQAWNFSGQSTWNSPIIYQHFPSWNICDLAWSCC